MKCPLCEGRKKIVGFACPGFMRFEMNCPLCEGYGEVSEQKMEWRRKGTELKEDRRRRNLTLRQEAERRGISATLLSKIEQGIVNPDQCG